MENQSWQKGLEAVADVHVMNKIVVKSCINFIAMQCIKNICVVLQILLILVL